MSTPLLTVDEAAKRLDISRRSVYRLIETDQLHTVDAFIAARTTPDGTTFRIPA
jgi:excisionase family DNA binding protein